MTSGRYFEFGRKNHSNLNYCLELQRWKVRSAPPLRGMEYFNNHTRYIRRCYAFSDISELPEERRPRPHSSASLDAFDSPNIAARDPGRAKTTNKTGSFHPRSKNYQVEPVDAETPSFSGIWRRLSSAKSNARSFFSSHNLVPRLLPAQLSLDCEREPLGT